MEVSRSASSQRSLGSRSKGCLAWSLSGRAWGLVLPSPPHHTLPPLCGGLGSLEPVNTGDKVPASPVLASRKPAAGRHRGDLSLSGPGSAPVKILLYLGL